MADGFVALGEIRNSQRPGRRGEKTYGKKKPNMAHTMALHFDLFGGGGGGGGGGNQNHDNKLVKKTAQMTVVTEQETVTEPPVDVEVGVGESATKEKLSTRSRPQKSMDLNPRLRGRRKATTSRKVVTLGQDKLQAVKPLLSLVQGEVRDFFEFGKSMGKKYDCVKLGEGAFADVFKFTAKDAVEASKLESYGGLVCKVIPFNLENSGSDDIADLESVSREVRTLFALDPLPGFVRCRGAHVVSGKYPDILLDAFNLYKTTNTAEAVNPDPTTAFPPDQMYVIIEMNDAGSPICKFKSLSAFQAFDTFWMTAMILHQAEQSLEFEHRDLHDGNICYRQRLPKGENDKREEDITEMTKLPEASVGLSDLGITIIDYTLARAKLKDGDDDIVVYDPIEFWDGNDAGSDNPADQKQYDTYRQVRDLAQVAENSAAAMAELDGTNVEATHKYQRFLPKSNVMWLGYLVMNLLLRRTGGRGDYLQGSSRVAKKLQLNMWTRLEQVDAYINKTTAELMPTSAGDLLETAVDQGWLSKSDIEACKALLEE